MISTFEFVIYFVFAVALCAVAGTIVVKLRHNENFRIALVAITGFVLLVEASGILH